MTGTLSDTAGTWTVGLIPLLIGVVLTAIAVSTKLSR
jgi:hypothetical protein